MCQRLNTGESNNFGIFICIGPLTVLDHYDYNLKVKGVGNLASIIKSWRGWQTRNQNINVEFVSSQI